MPKTLDYPNASLKKSLELAHAVSELGGTATTEVTANKLGKKISGAFHTLITSAGKYGLLTHRRGQLTTTEVYNEYKLAYSDVEATQILRKSFLEVSLFRRIYERFKTGKLPVEIFTKLLIKEFDVDEKHASRVTKYFTEGARLVGLLNQDNTFVDDAEAAADMGHDEQIHVTKEHESSRDETETNLNNIALSTFSIRITGPGINSQITLLEEEDLLIVDAMLNKVRKKLQEREQTSD